MLAIPQSSGPGCQFPVQLTWKEAIPQAFRIKATEAIFGALSCFAKEKSSWDKENNLDSDGALLTLKQEADNLEAVALSQATSLQDSCGDGDTGDTRIVNALSLMNAHKTTRCASMATALETDEGTSAGSRQVGPAENTRDRTLVVQSVKGRSRTHARSPTPPRRTTSHHCHCATPRDQDPDRERGIRVPGPGPGV